MMSWKIWFIGLTLTVAGLCGCCRQQSYLREPDYQDFRALACLPDLGADPGGLLRPLPGLTPPPATVNNPRREKRYLSLREAIAIALENGTVGVQNPLTPGTANDILAGFTAGVVPNADGIRVLALDPAIQANDIEISLSKFDTAWNTSLTWSRTETPLGTSPLVFLPPGVPTISKFVADSVSFSTGLAKPLPTGGVAGITFDVTGQRNVPASQVNPAIQPNIQFSFEQPLLQGFGEEINQILATVPTSTLMPGALSPLAAAAQVEGILLTRIRFDQQRAEFERNVNYMLLNVETAYWNLYNAYFQLYSREEGMRYTYEYWRLTKLLYDNGRVPIQTLEQIRLQYEQFRSQRLTALGQVLESERQLRGLLGLRSDDGLQIVPTDTPTLTPVIPDWQTALSETLARRPELILARQDLKTQELNLIRQRNFLLPDLRFIGTDQVHSLGSRLDGGDSPNNALHNLVSTPFNNWTLGLQLSVPIGYRAAHAAVREAQLAVRRSWWSLRTDEDKSERFLALAYRQVFEFAQQIEINRAALQAATGQLAGYLDLFRQGRAAAADANLILALQNYSTSLGSYYAAIVQYNNILATLEFAKGTIMERDKIFISEGPLPLCAQERAVEHERQRTKALVLHELTAPVQPQICPVCANGCAPKMPCVPENGVLPLPVLQQTQPPVPELPEARGADATPLAPGNATPPAPSSPPAGVSQEVQRQ
jgi:outer membrane protein TolC